MSRSLPNQNNQVPRASLQPAPRRTSVELRLGEGEPVVLWQALPHALSSRTTPLPNARHLPAGRPSYTRAGFSNPLICQYFANFSFALNKNARSKNSRNESVLKQSWSTNPSPLARAHPSPSIPCSAGFQPPPFPPSASRTLPSAPCPPLLHLRLIPVALTY